MSKIWTLTLLFLLILGQLSNAQASQCKEVIKKTQVHNQSSLYNSIAGFFVKKRTISYTLFNGRSTRPKTFTSREQKYLSTILANFYPNNQMIPCCENLVLDAEQAQLMSTITGLSFSEQDSIGVDTALDTGTFLFRGFAHEFLSKAIKYDEKKYLVTSDPESLEKQISVLNIGIAQGMIKYVVQNHIREELRKNIGHLIWKAMHSVFKDNYDFVPFASDSDHSESLVEIEDYTEEGLGSIFHDPSTPDTLEDFLLGEPWYHKLRLGL